MIHLPNCLPMIPLMFGIFAAGLTATLANPALTSRELAWLLQNSQPKVIITTLAALPTMEAAIQEVEDEAAKDILRHTKILTVDPAAKDYSGALTSTNTNSADWKALLQHAPLPNPVTFTTDECRRRTAVILWSSGTTGKSKGVLLSHTALTSSVSSGWHAFPEWGANERCLGLAPFYHVFGLVVVLLMAPSAGVTIVSMPRFELGLMLEYIEKHQITYLHTAPPVLVLLANSPLVKREALRSLKGAVSGGAPCPTAIIDRIYEKLGFYCKLVCLQLESDRTLSMVQSC
jgi:4-coumarate--CoA ligase